MRVQELIDLLKSQPRDAEIRVAACLEDPHYGGNSHDLPIVGISSDFQVPNVMKTKSPPGPSVHWLVTSYLLEPSAPAGKSKKNSKPSL